MDQDNIPPNFEAIAAATAELVAVAAVLHTELPRIRNEALEAIQLLQVGQQAILDELREIRLLLSRMKNAQTQLLNSM